MLNILNITCWWTRYYEKQKRESEKKIRFWNDIYL